MYVTINYELISWIEQEKSLKLKLNEAVLLSLVDSFRRQGQKCQMSQSAISEICMCKKTTVGNMIRNFKKQNILKVWYPPNQQTSQAACTLWLHNDIIDIIKELQAVSKNDIGPVSTAVSKNDTNNKIIGDSGSSFEEDPSSKPEETLENFLADINL